MSTSVFVTRTLTTERAGRAFFTLDDDVVLLLRRSPGLLSANAIFPWGTHTVFNRFQVPRLLHDLDKFVGDAQQGPDRDVVEGLAAFIRASWPDDSDEYLLCLAD